VTASGERALRQAPVTSASTANEGHDSQVLADPLVRAALTVTGIAPLVYLIVYAEVVAPVALGGYVAVAGAMLALLALRPVWASGDFRSSGAAHRLERRWQLFSGVVVVGLLGPVLVGTVEVDVASFAPMFASSAVASLCTMPWRWRLPMALWVVVVWLGTLIASGVRDVPTLLLNLGGGLLVVAAISSTAKVLSTNLVDAESLRLDAELHAGLLASVLRTNSLEPAEVLRATVDGLVEVGFDVAVIRALDHERELARLIEGTARHDTDLAFELPFEGTPIPAIIATCAPLVLEADSPDARMGPQQLVGLMHLPLVDGDRLPALISGGLLHRAIRPDELEAAKVLALQAGTALKRAEAYRADAATVEQLHEVDVRIQDFISTVSHELRTPLTVVQGLGQTLLKRWDDLDPDRRQDLLSRIDANAERLASMVRSLIDTSVFASGELELRPEPTRLRSSVHALLHRLASVTSKHPVTVDIPSELVVEVDPGLFQHVVENLLTNVAKHTPAMTRVAITARTTGDRVIMEVADAGPGIGARDLPHVLDRFYRGGDPNRRATSGLGLGLALAQEIVRCHGGEMHVVSALGEGTRFNFDVPATRPGGR
jgi:signal transduction histidine kinase